MRGLDSSTRRQFLGRMFGIASAGLTVPATPAVCSQRAAQREPGSRWQIGCFTRPWGRYDYRVAMDAIAEADFKYVGLMSTKPKDDAPWALVITANTPLEEARRAGEEAKKRGLRISSVFGGGIPVHGSLEAAIAALRRLIDNCAAATGASLLLAGINRQSLVGPYYKAFAECCDYAAEKHVALAIKPHGPLNATGPSCRAAIERVRHRNFTLWYDPGNIYAYSKGKRDPVDDAATVHGLVTGMCVKDYHDSMGVKVTPGDGRVDFPAVLAQLCRGGFSGGPLVIETLTPGDPDALLREAVRARRFVERLVRTEQVAGKPEEAESARRSVLLSKTGGDRATAYAMSNKIARRNGRLLCTWIDSSRQNRWALVDPDSGKVLYQGRVGDPRSDNHSGAAIATAPDGTLHLLTGEHHRPFTHYRMPIAEGRPVWKPVEDGKAVGVVSTYPSVVCDRRETLHLAYRHRALPHYSIDYCRRPAGGPWSKPRSLVRASVRDHTWLTNAIETGPEGRLHLVLSNTRPLAGGARYYGASHVYSDDSGQTWRQFGDTGPLQLPVEASRLKCIEGDRMDPDRTESKATHWARPPGPLNSYYHQILLSNLVVDADGRPWVILHNLLNGHARLYHARGGQWVGIPLHPAVGKLLPGLRIAHCGQLSRHNDGTLDVVLMVAPNESPGWGPKGTELVRMLISPDGRIRRTEPVCRPDPNMPHWLPSIERWCWNAPTERPALIYTRGFNAGGYGSNRNSVNTEVRLQLP